MAYSSLEKYPEANQVRRIRKNLVNERMLDTEANQSLKEIQSRRSNVPTLNAPAVSGGRLRSGLLASRLEGTGGGLPDEEALSVARAIGKGKQKLFGRTKMDEKRAEELGEFYGGAIARQDTEMADMVSSGMLEVFGRAFLKAFNPQVDYDKPKISLDALVRLGEAKPKKGSGKLKITHGDDEDESESDEEMEGCGGGLADPSTYKGSGRGRPRKNPDKKRRRPASGSDKRRQRGALVSKLMKEEGMSLAEASKYIKENRLI